MAEPVLLGLDLGTTTLAGRLTTTGGVVLAEAVTENPQKKFGDDVIRRLEAACAGKAEELQALLAGAVNRLVDKLLSLSGSELAEVSAAAVAANPAISLLLAGRSVEQILFPPHRPDYRAGAFLDSRATGINLPVPFYLFPLVSGYVGGDLVAIILAGGQPAAPTLYIDLGTNAELALWDGGQWLVTSVAAGPAFEAGHLSCGMRHGFGAVQRVSCVAERIELDVVGGVAPVGICGSGFFSAISAALRGGVLSSQGRIYSCSEVETSLSRYLVEDGGDVFLQLYHDARQRLSISQQDVRAFQLAKGAVAAGIACLLQRVGLNPGDVTSVRIAGSLGTSLPVADLKGVAMLPEIMLDKVRFLPSAVLDGVMVQLFEKGGDERVRRLAAELKPYPLSGTPAFEQSFIGSLDFA